MQLTTPSTRVTIGLDLTCGVGEKSLLLGTRRIRPHIFLQFLLPLPPKYVYMLWHLKKTCKREEEEEEG